jgi:hypothetical protein
MKKIPMNTTACPDVVAAIKALAEAQDRSFSYMVDWLLRKSLAELNLVDAPKVVSAGYTCPNVEVSDE